MTIQTKRVYETPAPDDGYRVLVDRIWPRGVRREQASVDEWLKELAPSTDLRKWFDHRPERWEEFQRLYSEEMRRNGPTAESLLDRCPGSVLTLVYSARDKQHNQAVALKEMLDRLIASRNAQDGTG